MRALWLLPLLAATLTAADISGKWAGNIEVEDTSGGAAINATVRAEFDQKAEAVTGKIGRENEEYEAIQNGKLVDGKRLVFEVSYPDANGAFKFELVLDGDRLEGKMTGEMDGGPITGKVRLARSPQSQ